jgi:Helix-turn-helix domain
MVSPDAQAWTSISIGEERDQAYRFEIGPSDRARGALASHTGAARFAFNWALGTVRAQIEAHRALVALALRQGASATGAKAQFAAPGPFGFSLTDWCGRR